MRETGREVERDTGSYRPGTTGDSGSTGHARLRKYVRHTSGLSPPRALESGYLRADFRGLMLAGCSQRCIPWHFGQLDSSLPGFQEKLSEKLAEPPGMTGSEGYGQGTDNACCRDRHYSDINPEKP